MTWGSNADPILDPLAYDPTPWYLRLIGFKPWRRWTYAGWHYRE